MKYIPSFLKQTFWVSGLIAICVLSGNQCFAQHEKEEPEEEEEKTAMPETFHPHHQLGLMIGHAHVFEGRDENGKSEVLSMPSWSFDYTYVFHPKWAIGLHTDFIMEKFKVEKSDGKEIIERSYPVAPAVMGIFKPTKHWNFMLGMGAEFAKEETFAVTRAAVEYGAEITDGWEVFGSVSYDFKWSAYDTWTIGLGISKERMKLRLAMRLMKSRL